MGLLNSMPLLTYVVVVRILEAEVAAGLGSAFFLLTCFEACFR
jgi:hypothetical protein